VARVYEVLTTEQAEHFLAHGWTVVHDCLDREIAERYTDLAYRRLGYDRDSPETWAEPMVHMPDMHIWQIKEFAPKAWGAICDVIGGEDRQGGRFGDKWSDCFIVNFSQGADRPWEPPSANVGGWHKDGNFFRHFLDSPEQGLLTIVLWSDVLPQSGGTFIAPDSVGHVARFLADHPEGADNGAGSGELISRCEQFVEVTGTIGDVFLLHPYMLHGSSQNPSGRPRFMTNPPVGLAEPMNFNRADSDDFSLVERKVLRDLGEDRLDFQITRPREHWVSDKKQREAEDQATERSRLTSNR
jgi:hypothetical protein